MLAVPRKSTDELQKHTLNLRAGDIEKIEALFPGKAPSTIVRTLISKFVDKSMAVRENPVAPPENL